MNEIYSRVSIRKFTDQQVEHEKILAMLRAAMQAPSAHNQQPWEFYVVTDKDMLEKTLSYQQVFHVHQKCANGHCLCIPYRS